MPEGALADRSAADLPGPQLDNEVGQEASYDANKPRQDPNAFGENKSLSRRC
jgi:hypothetical protein